MAQRPFREEPTRRNGAGDGDDHHDSRDRSWRAERDRLRTNLSPAGFGTLLLRRGRVGTHTHRVVLRSTDGERLSGSSDAGSVFLADAGGDLRFGIVATVPQSRDRRARNAPTQRGGYRL